MFGIGAGWECPRGLSEWPRFERQLRGVLGLLGSKQLRQRFQQLCLPRATERALFDSWSHQLIEWRWEVLENVLGKLLPVAHVLFEKFQAARRRNSV